MVICRDAEFTEFGESDVIVEAVLSMALHAWGFGR